MLTLSKNSLAKSIKQIWQRDYTPAQDAAKNFAEVFGWSAAQLDEISISKEAESQVKARLAEFAVEQAAFREPKPGETREIMMEIANMVVESFEVESFRPKISLLLKGYMKEEKKKEEEKEKKEES